MKGYSQEEGTDEVGGMDSVEVLIEDLQKMFYNASSHFNLGVDATKSLLSLVKKEVGKQCPEELKARYGVVVMLLSVILPTYESEESSLESKKFSLETERRRELSVSLLLGALSARGACKCSEVCRTPENATHHSLVKHAAKYPLRCFEHAAKTYQQALDLYDNKEEVGIDISPLRLYLSNARILKAVNEILE